MKYTLEDLKPYIVKLKEYDKLCIFQKSQNGFKDVIGSTIFLDGDGIPQEYHTLFSLKEINDEEDGHYDFNRLDKENTYIKVLSVEEWCKEYRTDVAISHLENMRKGKDLFIKHLFPSIIKDQGSFVDFAPFPTDQCGVLLSVSATDEDYYYVYLDVNDLAIKETSCVGGYIVAKDKENYNCPLTDEQISDKLYKEFIDNPYCLDVLLYLGKYYKENFKKG